MTSSSSSPSSKPSSSSSASASPDLTQAMEAVYTSLHQDNRDLDAHIARLKAALAQAGQKEAVFDPARLAQNNRSGRKLMQAYFRKRGVAVSFAGRESGAGTDAA